MKKIEVGVFRFSLPLKHRAQVVLYNESQKRMPSLDHICAITLGIRFPEWTGVLKDPFYNHIWQDAEIIIKIIKSLTIVQFLGRNRIDSSWNELARDVLVRLGKDSGNCILEFPVWDLHKPVGHILIQGRTVPLINLHSSSIEQPTTNSASTYIRIPTPFGPMDAISFAPPSSTWLSTTNFRNAAEGMEEALEGGED